MTLSTEIAGQEVRDALSVVRDPELDRAITELGFVAGVHIDSGRVHVRLRLPTYVAPDFAWLMVADAKAAVRALPWADSVEVCLEDDIASHPVSSGIGGDPGSADTFAALANDEPDDLRQALRRKAFLGRQHTLLRELLKRGLRRAELCHVTIGDLPPTADTAVYLQRRAELRLPIDADAPLVVTDGGTPVSPDDIDDHLARIRTVVVSSDGNEALRRASLQASYQNREEQP